MTRSINVLLAAAAVVAGLGGCGGADDGGGSGDRARELRDAGVQYARCMRANGIDMPDPKTDENGVRIEEGGDGAPFDGSRVSDRLRLADEKCRKHLDDIEPPQLSEEQQREFRQQALAHAKCMRDNGVDFPDPKFSEDGGAVVDSSALDLDSPTYKRAEEKCRHLMRVPGGGS